VDINESPAASMSAMSGALAEPLSKCACSLRRYDTLWKVLRLLREDVDEEPFETWEEVRDRLQVTPHVPPTAEEEEISDAIGRVWMKQLKTIDERLRWKMQPDLLDIHGIAHVEGLGTTSVANQPEWQAAALSNSGDAWNALRLVFARLNADVQLRRTGADDVWGRDFKWKMETFSHSLAIHARELRADIDEYNGDAAQQPGRLPNQTMGPDAVQEYFMRLLICVFDDGLRRGPTRDAYGEPDTWERNEPKADPSHW
jgi:hypothetical protein